MNSAQNDHPSSQLQELLEEFLEGTQRELRRRRRGRYGTVFLVIAVLGGALAISVPTLSPLVLLILVAMGYWNHPGRQEISPQWVARGTQLMDGLGSAPKELLPGLFILGELLEKLPLIEGRRNEHRKANRMTFELQEAIFMALTRILSRRVPQELVLLDGPQRDYLRRAIFRTADSSFIACALLVLATLQDSTLHPEAKELAERHPSERIREAAGEYLRSLATS
jgi:hypothetical protein